MDENATGNLKPNDETQVAKRGTRIGLLPKSKVLADFRKIVRGNYAGCKPGSSRSSLLP